MALGYRIAKLVQRLAGDSRGVPLMVAAERRAANNARQMMLESFEALAAALERAGVRYLVAGGLAVNAHGYVRYTKDVDLVIHLGARFRCAVLARL